MTDEQTIVDFLSTCSRTMTELAQRPQHVAGAGQLAERLAGSHALDFKPSWLPALDSVTQVDDGGLGRQFSEVAPLLRWVPTLRADDGGTDFALSPLNEVRDFGEAIVGLMYVRPGAQYPLHRHPPQELYLTIAGQADWRFGGHEDFRPIGPGNLIYNNPNDYHSAIAGPAPLVALYVLWD